jgi:beta-glucosidase-like glycosyl hydrolase
MVYYPVYPAVSDRETDQSRLYHETQPRFTHRHDARLVRILLPLVSLPTLIANISRYPLNISRHNELQQLNLEKAHLKIPFMHVGECLHGVGSFKQSMFPQSIGLAATFNVDLIHRVGHAIGTEARSIGIHACLSPVLDLGQDPRWGRLQGCYSPFSRLFGMLLTNYRGLWRGQDADFAYGSCVRFWFIQERFMV